jgi:hypothetical protein
MMRSIRLLGLTLVTESQLSCGRLHGKGRILNTAFLRCGQMAVAVLVQIQRGPRVGEDGGCVAPIEHEEEEEPERGGELSYNW